MPTHANPAPRCRLCSTNDVDGLEDELAGELWMAARDSEVDPDWENAPPYWQRVFKLYARTTIRVMSHNHG